MEVPSHVRLSVPGSFKPSHWLCWVSLFLLSPFIPCSALVTSSRDISDRSALLALKSLVTSDDALSSWNTSFHYCDWQGVTCASPPNHDRVSVLDLRSQKLQGTLSPYIGNLTFLKRINLSENSFQGAIPEEIGRLFRLEYLSLGSNFFNSEVPTNISRCSNLRAMDLVDNSLSGNVPSELSSLPKLQLLYLGKNNFTGHIPPSLANLSSLNSISLSDNHLEGSIPEVICRTWSLEFFQVSSNNLTGKVPSCLYNQSNMYSFSVAVNQLEGNLPPNIGLNLPSIQEIYFGMNKFSGTIPVSLSNATRLEYIGLSVNYLTGRVPRDLGSLSGLRAVWFNSNQLGTRVGDDLEFITSLTNCTRLEKINIAANYLRGPIPDSISNLSATIKVFFAGENRIYGSIPAGIQNLVNMEVLALYGGYLTGDIPAILGKLNKVQEIYLSENKLSGTIPASLGNLTQLRNLDLSSNLLRGSIPPTLGKCKNLAGLNLSFNQLTGTIPQQVIGLSSLTLGLLLHQNSLTGSLPSQVGNLTNLIILTLSSNKISGHIPESLGKCLSLVTLSMNDNSFQGKIPKSFEALRGLEYFDISQNNLSGEIPKYFEKFPLWHLNVSFNQLEGQVPSSGVFANASMVSVIGNKNLCGGLLELELLPCTKKVKKRPSFIKVIVPVIFGSLFLFAFSCFLLRHHRKYMLKKNPSSTTLFNQLHERVTYLELFKATNGFSADNLIGTGSYGSVYKGNLPKINQTAAVKVLDLQREGASESFFIECNAFRNLRHRNLIKIITACSSVDAQGNDFKALIFDYMPNGSLEEWLHPRENEQQLQSKKLNFTQRLSIAIDVASAMEYLHHCCQPKIIHCDLKPSNVLLNDDTSARVADFGIARLISTTSHDSAQSLTNSVLLKGSIGYMAPEYGMNGEVSTQGDVYSFGILLLEIFTGKKPTDNIFQNGLTLHNYSKMALPNQVMGIADPGMLVIIDDLTLHSVVQDNTQSRLHESLVSVINLGVVCSAELPKERMTMSEVVTELHYIRDHHQHPRRL